MSKPRVDAVIGTFYRKGKCEVCGKHVERERSFRGTTYADMEQQGAAWGATPLVHKRCES